MTDWLSIDCAPRDGTYIWLATDSSMRIGWWASGSGYEVHGSVGGGWIDMARAEAGGPRSLTFSPTHWQRLPALPARQTPGAPS